jgi:hypothetical protein
MTTVPDPQIIQRRDGLDAYGIFLNYVMYNASTGALEQEFRYFVADDIVCKYARMSGNKRAAWNTYKTADHDAAIDMLRKAIEALPVNTEQLHDALIVELTEADIDNLRKAEAPVARFAGSDAVQKVLGKVNDETWKPAGWTA